MHKMQAQLKEDLEAIAGMPWVTEQSDGSVTVEIQVHREGQQTEPLNLPITVASDTELALLCDVVPSLLLHSLLLTSRLLQCLLLQSHLLPGLLPGLLPSAKSSTAMSSTAKSSTATRKPHRSAQGPVYKETTSVDKVKFRPITTS